jgi:hypothetical protein
MMRSAIVAALCLAAVAPQPAVATPGRRPDTSPLHAPPHADEAMGLLATDFGAVGDNLTDDSAALQAAVDAAQGLGRRLFVPAGRYLLSQPLLVRCYDSWPDTCHPKANHSLTLVGEGMSQTRFIATGGAAQEAVLKLCSGSMSDTANLTSQTLNSSGFHRLEHFTVQAGGAQYGILAPRLTRTDFYALQVGGASRVGIFASGWNNRLESCHFSSNVVGVLLGNQANGVAVTRCNFEGANGVGLAIFQGEMVNIEGNCIEGNDGIGILLVGVRGLRIAGNYFVRCVLFHSTLSGL